jgi:hypothetical protein
VLVSALAANALAAPGANEDFENLAEQFVSDLPTFSPVGSTWIGDHSADSELDEVDRTRSTWTPWPTSTVMPCRAPTRSISSYSQAKSDRASGHSKRSRSGPGIHFISSTVRAALFTTWLPGTLRRSKSASAMLQSASNSSRVFSSRPAPQSSRNASRKFTRKRPLRRTSVSSPLSRP